MYRIERFVSADAFAENTYVLYDLPSKEALIIDPGGAVPAVIRFIQEKGLSVAKILATHCHVDHLIGAPALARRYHVPLLMHRADSELLAGVPEQAAAFGLVLGGTVRCDGFFEEGASFAAGGTRVAVLHTPGHTPGSSCFSVEDQVLFTGDTLFAGSIGRTDLQGGSYPDIMKSLRRLASLPAGTVIYPGHEDESTIGVERATNPFLIA